MRNTVLKGSRNSRSIIAPVDLKSRVYSLDDLLDLFIAGFECDLGPLNPAGCEVIGDDLNKENLLSDETAALYPGLPENPVPDDVLSAIRPLLDTALARAKIMTGSYTGTGSYGSTNPNSISFPFIPKLVFISAYVDSYNDNFWDSAIFPVYALHTEYFKNGYILLRNIASTNSGFAKFSGTKLMWYTENSGGAFMQLNKSGAAYRYTAIG